MLTKEFINLKVVHADPLRLALDGWKFSRPNETNAKLEDVLAVDVPVNDFPRITIEMTIPIILREWLVSFRDHLVWARTSRVDNLDHWPVYYQAMNLFEADLEILYEKMQKEKMLSQDHFRSNLPLSYMTGLRAQFGFRSALKVLATASDMAVTHKMPLCRLFSDFAWHLAGAIINEYPGMGEWIWNHIKKVKPNDPLAKDFSLRTNYYGQLGGFVAVARKDVPLTLRAQVARHRSLMLRDNLRTIMQRSDALALPISTPMDIEISCTVQEAERILAKRNCWIAQADLWEPILDGLREVLPQTRDPALPCSGGAPCPFVRDNELRADRKDPAPPCPIYTKREGKEVDVISAMFRYSDHRHPYEYFWANKVRENAK